METMMISLLGGTPHVPRELSDANMCSRVTEGLCRSLNNLLEHLHQSFFFYFILSPTGTFIGEPGRFVSIGTYLPAAIIIAASFSITSVALWIQTSRASKIEDQSQVTQTEKTQLSKPPPVRSELISFALGIVSFLHGLGFVVLVCFDWIQYVDTVFVIPPSLFTLIIKGQFYLLAWYSNSRSCDPYYHYEGTT